VFSLKPRRNACLLLHPSAGPLHFQIGYLRGFGAEHEVGIEAEGQNFPE